MHDNSDNYTLSLSSLYNELKQVSKRSFIYVIGSTIIRSFGLITMPIMTYYLVPEEYGILAMCTLISNLFGYIFTLGQLSSYQKFYYIHRENDWKVFFSTSLVILTVLGIIVAFLLLTIGEKLLNLIAPQVPVFPHLTIAISSGFFLAYYQTAMQMLQIREQPKRYVKVNVSRGIIHILLLILFLIGFREKLIGVLLANLITAIIGFFIFIVLVKDDLALTFNMRMAKETIRYGAPLVPHSLSGFISTQIGRVFIANNINLGAVGLYSIGATISSGVETVISGINSAWVPFTFRAAKERGAEGGAFIGRMATYFFVLSWSITFFFILFGQEIIQVLAGNKYAGSTVVIAPLMMSVMIHAMYYRFVTSIFFSQRTELVAISSFISAMLNIALNWYLVPRVGIVGSAWSVSASYTVISIMVLIIGQKVYWVGFEWSRIGKLALSFLIAFALSLLISNQINFWKIVLLKSCILLLVPFFLFIFSFYNEGERNNISRIYRKIIRAARQ